MKFYRNYTLPLISLTLALGACSNNSSSTPATSTPGTTTSGMLTPGPETTVSSTAVAQPIEFVELVENAAVPVSSFFVGAQQATGYGNSAGLNYILTNNQRVVIFTDDVEPVDSFEIPMLATVSGQALSAEEGVLAVLDSQGQLYVKLLDDEAVNVIAYNYPVTQEFAALTYGQEGDWLTVNRSGAKTLYTLELDGDLGSMALDSRLTDYEVVGADVDGNLFVLSNTFQQQRQTNIFEIDSQGQVVDAWSLSHEDGLVPSALNVNITDQGVYEFVIAHEDSMATVKLTEAPGGTDEPEASMR